VSGVRLYRLCQVLGCDRRHYARGMCRSHYRQWSRGVRAALVLPEPRYGSPVDVGPRKGPREHLRRSRAPLGPPYGWAHLPVGTDADGALPEGPFWDEARVSWGPRNTHAVAVLRDDRLPWWEVGLRAPWSAVCQADAETRRAA